MRDLQRRNHQTMNAARKKNLRKPFRRHARFPQPEYFHSVAVPVGGLGDALEKFLIQLGHFPAVACREIRQERDAYVRLHGLGRAAISHQRRDERVGPVAKLVGNVLNFLLGLGRDVRLLAQGARDRHHAHARAFGDLSKCHWLLWEHARTRLGMKSSL